VPKTKCSHVFPMAGDECGTQDANAPPEGTRIRLKASVNLQALGLGPAALVIARALQTYGATIGEQSGGDTHVYLENTVAEGRGFLWNGKVDSAALSAIPLSD